MFDYYETNRLVEIKATPHNRKMLRKHAKEAMLDYSPIMTWLALDNNGDLYIEEEPQGQTFWVGTDEVIAQTGSFYKYYGDGAVSDDQGNKYKTQRAYLIDLLGEIEYNRIFCES